MVFQLFKPNSEKGLYLSYFRISSFSSWSGQPAQVKKVTQTFESPYLSLLVLHQSHASIALHHQLIQRFCKSKKIIIGYRTDKQLY